MDSPWRVWMVRDQRWFRIGCSRSLPPCPTAVHLPPQFPGCFPAGPNDRLWTFWIPSVTFESVLLVLSVVKLFDEWREVYVPKVMILLLRDSAIYFAAVLAALVNSMVIWAFAAGRVSLVFPPSTDRRNVLIASSRCSQLSSP